MGLPHSKLRKPNNPMEEQHLKAMRKQRKLKKLQQDMELKERVSKKKKRKLNQMPSEPEPPPPPVVPQSLTKDKYDQLATDEMRRQLQFKFSSFILNQLLLSFQFYGNFEREKLSAQERCSALEHEINEKLQMYSVILPNVLDEALEQHVLFQKKHGPTKNQLTKLHTQTIYIVFENVHISKPKDANYDVISRSRQICKVFIDTENTQAAFEKKKFFKGYVRLKYGQAIRNRRSIKNFDSIRRIANVPEQSVLSVNENAEHQPVQAGEDYSVIDLRSSISSYTNSSTATYDYSYITSLNTHQPLSHLSGNDLPSNIEGTVLPNECVSRVFITSENTSDLKSDDNPTDGDSEDESGDEDEYGTETLSEYLEVRYLNSKEFLRYFENLLEQQLASTLNLTKDDLKAATWMGASIFTSSYEIVPALHFPHWPECAFEWINRKRNVHINPLSGKQLVWPTQDMIKEVVSLGCHAIPLGYASKKYKNPTRDLEWKIVFPEAERYLESKLSSTQVKVYMLCKALIRTYVEPLEENGTSMFTLDHLRAHLFLSCEENYAAWPEEFLGEALLRFLRSFLHRLSLKDLPDYFMPERNLFESIPESYMVRLYQIISQIVQNPVMHVMMAYRNLNLDAKFYPNLNYKKLYDCLVEDPIEVIKRMATSITISGNYIKMSEQHKENVTNDADNEEDHPEGLIGYSHKREMKDRSKRRKTRMLKQQEKLKMQKKLEAEKKRRASEDSIDLEFMIKDHYGPTKSALRSTPDEVRRALVIDVFINYFISMAREAYKLKILDQCKIYLNQASRLCTLLGEYRYEEQARKFAEKIGAIKRTVQTEKPLESITGPALPSRLNLESVRKNKKSTIISSDPDEIFSDTKPGTPTKVVQFKDGFNFIEPRSFYGDDTISLQRSFNTKTEKVKLNGILKQSGSSVSDFRETAARKPGGAIDDKSDNDSISCTEL